ncbi:Hypothetical predicted protein [Olea europaea subsp. europaea]|uniref:DUF1985 domain-containing protein n=1 Tax=Olea europaea subsp. europaea TaxID=158383 RepID=A0A8S0SIB9_OLEEU|nr:Hypothetical predicted protein [Olea europaea subsp. europaea]
MWFYVAGRYVRFSISEFCLVTGLRCHEECDIQMYDNGTSKLKGKYFSQMDTVTHEDIKSTLFSTCQMPKLDLVETLSDDDVARMDEQPFAAKLEGVGCFVNVDVIPRHQELSPREKSPIDEAPSAAHNFSDEPHPHRAQWVDVQTVQPNVDTKGKDKIDPSEAIGTPCSLQPPSFYLGIEYMQHDDVYSEDIQKQVDFVISDMVTATKSVQVEGSTSPEGRSELPVKWVSRSVRILQSPFVVGDGKLFKHDNHAIVFEHFKGDVEEVDRSTFMRWFQRGFKSKNKKKFNDEEDKIKPAFVISSFPVGHKSWFYNLIHKIDFE